MNLPVSQTDWLHEPRDPRCNTQLPTSFFKPKDSFLYPMSYTCLTDFVHPRELRRYGGMHFPSFTQSVTAVSQVGLDISFTLEFDHFWRAHLQPPTSRCWLSSPVGTLNLGISESSKVFQNPFKVKNNSNPTWGTVIHVLLYMDKKTVPLDWRRWLFKIP